MMMSVGRIGTTMKTYHGKPKVTYVIRDRKDEVTNSVLIHFYHENDKKNIPISLYFELDEFRKIIKEVKKFKTPKIKKGTDESTI